MRSVKDASPSTTLRGWLATALWAAVLGAISGLACVGVRLFFRLLQLLFLHHGGLLPDAASMLSPVRRAVTPAIGGACAMTILWAAHRWSGARESTDYVKAVREGDGEIPFGSTFWRTVSSAFSVATGAAIGREGSMIQFAAGVCSWVGRRSPIRSLALQRQVAYGVAAAVGAVYQAPIAAIFFVLEIVVGEWDWAELPFLALASSAGWLVSRTLLDAGPLFPVHDAIPLGLDALWALPLAVLLGMLGPLYQGLLRNFKVAGRLPLALVVSGLLVGLLSLRETTVWGNGDVALTEVLARHPGLESVAVLLAIRLVATAFCVGTGTIGGVFTPTLFAGAAVGLAAGYLVHASEPVLLAVVALGGLMAAVTHAPMMAALMAVELTGEWRLLPVLLVCNLIAWQVAKTLSPRSLYAIASPNPTIARET